MERLRHDLDLTLITILKYRSAKAVIKMMYGSILSSGHQFAQSSLQFQSVLLELAYYILIGMKVLCYQKRWIEIVK